MNTRTMDGLERTGSGPSAVSDAGLVLLYAPQFAKLPAVHRFDREVVMIGREPPPGEVALPQEAVSRLHARVAWRDGAWWLADLRSRNGTILNGHLVDETPLAPGDELRIGDIIFQFVSSNIGAFARYRIDGAELSEGALPAHPSIVGGLRIRTILAELAAASRTDLPVLVCGESGTGKDLVARTVHESSGRSGVLAFFRCAAISPALLERELLGLDRDSLMDTHDGSGRLIREAQQGTLLLDEIGDMSLDVQGKLLRMLDRVNGSHGSTPGDEHAKVRLVLTTHRDLRGMVERGEFRGDLFSRLQGYMVSLPPLRDRKEDLFSLLRHLVATVGHAEVGVSMRFMAAVCHYDWPFNVRELEAAVRRALAIADGELDVPHLPEAVRAAFQGYGSPAPPAASTVGPTSESHVAPSADQLRTLLRQHGGNVAAMARDLRKDRAQVHRWLRRAGINPTDFRR